MSMKLIECIPNFSEARRPEVVEAIIEAVRNVEGTRILDTHSDLDHNRTVLTFVGSPEAVEEAAFQAIAKAKALIDLEQHQGEHPRIGATDVVPFVPISGINMVECVEMARRLGKRVGEMLQIPVYLYEEAATRPDRVNLEDIRRGQYEGLKEEIINNPNRKPDFGPTQMGKAGATVIGARSPLIAYNIYLTTGDVGIADKIARRVRNSSGGFHFVKAMGVLVEGMAQVSMNLTNFKRSPMAQVTEMVRREAQRYGTTIHHTELVGLIPNDALIAAAQWYLQMDQFEARQVLETRLFENAFTGEESSKFKEDSFLDAVSAGTPTPGGGSASAHAGALAAALVAMVARLTAGKPKYADVQDQVWQVIDQAEILRKQLDEGVQKDSEAFELFMQARKLPKNTEDEQNARAEEISRATYHAASVPLENAQNAHQVLQLALTMATIGNVNAISDAGAAANLAIAAIKAAGLNVRINLVGKEDEQEADNMLQQLRTIEATAIETMSSIEELIKTRGGLAF